MYKHILVKSPILFSTHARSFGPCCPCCPWGGLRGDLEGDLGGCSRQIMLRNGRTKINSSDTGAPVLDTASCWIDTGPERPRGDSIDTVSTLLHITR